MFGQSKFAIHPKTDKLVDTVSRRAKHPQKLRSPNLLTKGTAIATTRFGGKTVFLWVKNKTRVWIDKTSAWITHATFPKEFLSGILLQAEMFRENNHDGKWVIAFEDILIQNGEVIIDTVPFIQRLPRLITQVQLLTKYTDPKHDPGAYAVKPWFYVADSVEHIKHMTYRKQPSFLLIKFLQRNITSTRPDNGLAASSFFMKIEQTLPKDTHMDYPSHEGVALSIHKMDISEPDQYMLIHPSTSKTVGRACIRTMQNSLWLRSLKDGALVWCKFSNEHKTYEPYADVVVKDDIIPMSTCLMIDESIAESHTVTKPVKSTKPRTSHSQRHNIRKHSHKTECLLI